MRKKLQLPHGVLMYRNNHTKGVTLTEMMAAVAITSMVVLVIVMLLTSVYKSSTDIGIKIDGQQEITNAMRIIEKKLLHANEILTASTTEVMFLSDINTWENYDKNADFDGDGQLNYLDCDLDNDATCYVSAADMWKVGYNLKDDDEDGDGQEDMAWRLYINNRSVYSDYSYNGEAWGNHVKSVATDISTTSIFGYYGSKDTNLSVVGASIDTDGNGLVTSSEIDAFGNSNGELDLEDERDCIVLIAIYLDTDTNDDDIIDYWTVTDVMPPLLYLKRNMVQ